MKRKKHLTAAEKLVDRMGQKKLELVVIRDHMIDAPAKAWDEEAFVRNEAQIALLEELRKQYERYVAEEKNHGDCLPIPIQRSLL